VKHIHILFRRTAFVLGALAALTATGEASAQAGTINLNNSTANSCSYSSMTVSPNGSIEVTCDGGTTPPAGTYFSVSNYISSVNTGATSTKAFKITRGGTAAASDVPFTISGQCTLDTPATSSAEFLSATPSVDVYITPTGSSGGTCSIQMGTPTTGTINGTSTRTIVVSGVVAGCPSNSIIPQNLGATGALTLLKMSSGGITSFVLPAITDNTRRTGVFKVSPTTVSYPVAPWNYEINISKCKGVIDSSSAGAKCYKMSSNNADIGTLQWLGKPGGTYTQAAMETRGYCYAPEGDGPWYVNVRYTYADCRFGSTAITCGWHTSWSTSAY